MTKERLEELMKQGGKKQLLYNNVSTIIFDMGNCYIDNDILVDNKDHTWWFIGHLFETKEEAEWHNKTYAERTERFEPPMWEEIDYYCFSFVQPNNDFVKFEVKKHNYIEISESEYEELFYKSGEEATKENYEKACEIVRDLFKGEK